MKIKAYTLEVKVQMRHFYHSLSEKDRRRYAAVEAKKLGYGGITYICKVLGCDAGTVTSDPWTSRFRTKFAFSSSTYSQTWRRKEIRTGKDRRYKGLAESGLGVSVTVVDQLLDKHNFRRRQAFKAEAGKKNIPHRDEQFQKIELLKQQYDEQGNPVMSMDVKKKN